MPACCALASWSARRTCRSRSYIDYPSLRNPSVLVSSALFRCWIIRFNGSSLLPAHASVGKGILINPYCPREDHGSTRLTNTLHSQPQPYLIFRQDDTTPLWVAPDQYSISYICAKSFRTAASDQSGHDFRDAYNACNCGQHEDALTECGESLGTYLTRFQVRRYSWQSQTS